MNNVYLYDGSFSSLLALIEELENLSLEVNDIKSIKDYSYNILDETINLKIDNKKDNIENLKKKITKNILTSMYYVYLSCDNNKEKIIYNFYKLGKIYKNKIYFLRYIDSVNSVINISKYVLHEAHKLKGFLRFSKTQNNFLYAKYKSNNNVLGLLANHFMKRLSSEYFIIKDIGRDNYALYNKEKITFLTGEDIVKLNLNFDSEEMFFEDLWKTFFKTIAIKERENKRAQINFMPKRYWENMLEMEDKL